MQRYLRQGGRLILREVTSDNKLLLWFMDKIELPLANLCGHGDVKIATRGLIADCCKQVGLKVEKSEIRKGMRLHCVVRKAHLPYKQRVTGSSPVGPIDYKI